MSYQKDDLQTLHSVLLDILKEIIRICDILDIDYFIQGGTAIGAFFEKGFVPWDDDIDLGMTRKDFERFVRQAPPLVGEDYFIQCPETDPNTPFYYIKFQKKHTLFVEYQYKDLDMHQGIFVDIFPYDNVPDNAFLERIHRRAVQYMEGSLKRRQVYGVHLERFSFLPNPLAKVFAKSWYGFMQLIPKSFFFWRLRKVQTFFNRKKTKFVSIVKSPRDQIAIDTITPPVKMMFEGIEVKAPDQIETYLRHHYPHLAPTVPEDQQINHAPYILSFDTRVEH